MLEMHGLDISTFIDEEIVDLDSYQCISLPSSGVIGTVGDEEKQN